MLNKTDVVLLVFKSIGTIKGRTYLQKIFFLIEQEITGKVGFNYTKYNYGPFSKSLQLSVNKMVGIEVEERDYDFGPYRTRAFKLTKKGQSSAERIAKENPRLASKIENYCKEFKDHTPGELLRFVYSKYPEWTKNSVLV